MRQEVPGIEELIARARAGDAAALDALFQWCRPLLAGWAERGLAKRRGGLAQPSDIAQEAAMKAYRGFPAFKGTTQPELLGWLQAIVETCTKQSFRDAGRKKRDKAGEVPLDGEEIPAHQPSPSQAAADGEQWQQVFSQIFQLPDEQRQAIWFCHLKELPVSEVARRMGKTEGAVAGLLQRGLKGLRGRVKSASEPAPAAADDPRRTGQAHDDTAAALLVYLRRRETGERVDLDAFVAEHPSCGEELRHTITWIERIEALRPARIEE